MTAEPDGSAMTDTVIVENHKMRQLGGRLLVLVGVPLTLLVGLVGFSGIGSLFDLVILLSGPALLAFGLWAAFPRRAPKPKLTISDKAITIEAPRKVIPLDDLSRIKRHVPVLAKHERLTFVTSNEEVCFDVIHLTHEGRDIINLIGIRLEQQNKSLHEGRTAVRGALTGVWEVRSGTPFVTDPNHDKITHGPE